MQEIAIKENDATGLNLERNSVIVPKGKAVGFQFTIEPFVISGFLRVQNTLLM